MGAVPFDRYADGADVDAAFCAACDAAATEHGHGGYSGTIVEKHNYVIITRELMSLDDAHRLAGDLIDRGDHRIDDKWGPAGAIPVRQATRIVVDDLSGPVTITGRLDTDGIAAVARIARQRGLTADGDTVTDGRLRSYTPTSDPPRRGRGGSRPPAAMTYTNGVAELTVDKSPDALAAQTRPDGWLVLRLGQLLTRAHTNRDTPARCALHRRAITAPTAAPRRGVAWRVRAPTVTGSGV